MKKCNDNFHVLGHIGNESISCDCGKMVISISKCPFCNQKIIIKNTVNVNMSTGSRKEKTEKLIKELS